MDPFQIDPDTRIWLALAAVGAGVVVAPRVRGELPSQLALFAGFAVAGWLVQSVHEQRYPEHVRQRLHRALNGKR